VRNRKSWKRLWCGNDFRTRGERLEIHNSPTALNLRPRLRVERFVNLLAPCEVLGTLKDSQLIVDSGSARSGVDRSGLCGPLVGVSASGSGDSLSCIDSRPDPVLHQTCLVRVGDHVKPDSERADTLGLAAGYQPRTGAWLVLGIDGQRPVPGSAHKLVQASAGGRYEHTWASGSESWLEVQVRARVRTLGRPVGKVGLGWALRRPILLPPRPFSLLARIGRGGVGIPNISYAEGHSLPTFCAQGVDGGSGGELIFWHAESGLTRETLRGGERRPSCARVSPPHT